MSKAYNPKTGQYEVEREQFDDLAEKRLKGRVSFEAQVEKIGHQQAEPGADERAAFEAALKQYAEACHRSESSSSMDAARARVCAIFSRAAQSGQRAGVDGDAKQIADLVLGRAEGLRVSSPLETRKGFGNDVEHYFEVSDGVTRFGVVIILTKLKDAAPTQQQEGSQP